MEQDSGQGQFGVRVSEDRTANAGATLRSWAHAGACVVLRSSIDIIDDVKSGRFVPVLTEFELAEGNHYNLYAVTPAGRRQSRRVKHWWASYIYSYFQYEESLNLELIFKYAWLIKAYILNFKEIKQG